MINMTFKVITPILLRRGVIERNDKKYYYSDLSGQTFRGLLRWWFRFFAISCYSSQKVLKFEKILFGSSGDSGTGASPVAIIPIIDESVLEAWENYRSKLPAYFTGFRFSVKNKIFKVIPPSKEVKVHLLWQLWGNRTPKKVMENKNLEEKSAKDLLDRYEEARNTIFNIYKNLLKALSIMGGVGAAWRRCLGSLQLKENLSMSNLNELKGQVYKIKKTIFESLKKLGDIFEISSLGDVTYCAPNYCEAKILQIDEADNWKDVIEAMTYPKTNTRRDKSSFLQELRATLERDYGSAIKKEDKEETEKIAMARAFLGYPLKHLVIGFFIKNLNELKNNGQIEELKYTPVYKKLVFPRDADELAQMCWPNRKDKKKRNELKRKLREKIPKDSRYLRINRIPSVLILTVKKIAAKKIGDKYVGLGIYVPYWKECGDLFPQEYGKEIDKYLTKKIDDILKINCSSGGI